jgi:hypothetical protein
MGHGRMEGLSSVPIADPRIEALMEGEGATSLKPKKGEGGGS